MVKSAKQTTEAPASKAKLAKKPTASSKSAAKVVPDGEAMPSKKAKPNNEVAAGRKRKAAASTDTGLATVSHNSHGKLAGSLFVIGDGDCGQFGLGEDVVEAPRPIPTSPAGLQARKLTIQAAAGGMHCVALAANHEVWTTGVNDEGALGRPTASKIWENAGVPLTDAYTWGKVDVPSLHGRVVQVAAGDSHTVALTEKGAVYAWGTYRDATGVFGFAPGVRVGLLATLVWDPKKAAEQAVKVASGTDHTVILTHGGEIYTWGTGGQGQLGRVAARINERHMQEVLLQPHPVKRLKRSRGVSIHTPVVDVACGHWATYAVDEAGHVWAWGLNNYGQLGMPGQEPVFTPHVATNLQAHTVTQLRGGQHHSLALTQEGQLLSFGRPTYGRLGRLDVAASSDNAAYEAMPVDGLDGLTVVGMSADIMVSGCFTSNGDAYLWGANTNSQIGKGNDDTDEVTPLKLKETKRFKDRKVISMEIGGQMALLLTVPAEGAAPQPAASKGAVPQAAASNAAAAAAVVATSSIAEGSTHAPPEPAPAEADASA
ncbi:MAG: regulator of chromosome condensation [Trebouxia sp. A1-2]|nr:MAG: regulator of chromosome condensation [Trebouxia sp. A1-2]